VPELIERMKCGDTERRERVVPMQIIIAMLGAAKVADSASLAQQALENDIVGATMRILTLAPQAEPQPEPEPCVSASTVSVSEGVPPGVELMAVGVAAVQDVNAQAEQAIAQQMLKMLIAERIHGSKIQMELDKYAAWKDFSTADHSLFMPTTSHSSATSGGGSAGGGGAQMLADGVARV